MKRSLLLGIVAFTIVAAPLAASVITGALYEGAITATNTSYTAQKVSVPFDLGTQGLLDGGYIGSDFSNVALQNSSGEDVAFMPGQSGNPWMMFIPQISQNSALNYSLYTGGTTDMEGDLAYFPGAGGMTVADDASLEIGDNFEIELSGYIDTSVNGSIISKTSALDLDVDSGNVNAEITYGEASWDKLTNPADLPPYNGNGVAFSSDDTYMAVAHGISPNITIYKRSGDTFTKLPNPADLPANQSYGVAFSSDGTYLAVAHGSSPYVTIYKRSGDTFTKLPNPADLPTNQGNGVAFSPDDTYMTVTHANSPYITIYKRSGDTFTKLPNPTSLPPSNAYDVAFSPDGTYMAVAHLNSPYVTIYKRSGDTFTKLADPASRPSSNAYGIAFSSSGSYMAVTGISSPYITIYKRSGDTFTKLTAPADLPTGMAENVAFSSDDTYMTVTHANSPYITIYKRSGDTFIKEDDPTSLPTGTGYDVSYSSDDTYMAVSHADSPYITIYKKNGTLDILNLTAAIESDEPIIKLTADSTDLKLYIDGVEKDTVALNGATALDNANDWIMFASGNVPYMYYTKITVGGVLKGHWYWEYDTTFTDQSGNGNTATPTFRTTTTDADVSAELKSFTAISQSVFDDTADSSGPEIVTDADLPPVFAGFYVDLDADNLPNIGPAINGYLDDQGWPHEFFWLPVVYIGGAAITMVAFRFTRKLLPAAAAGIIWNVFFGATIGSGFWGLIPIGMIAGGELINRKKVSV